MHDLRSPLLSVTALASLIEEMPAQTTVANAEVSPRGGSGLWAGVWARAGARPGGRVRLDERECPAVTVTVLMAITIGAGGHFSHMVAFAASQCLHWLARLWCPLSGVRYLVSGVRCPALTLCSVRSALRCAVLRCCVSGPRRPVGSAQVHGADGAHGQGHARLRYGSWGGRTRRGGGRTD